MGGACTTARTGPRWRWRPWRPWGRSGRPPPQSGRTHLAWGHASYGAGTEDFGWRVRVEARRRGAPWPCWATGPSGSGGAPGTAVVEIVDIVRAYGYLRDVATAVGGAGTAAASAWVEPPKDRLYQRGAAPVLAALAALSPLPAAAAEAHHDALSYFTANATRMDYPRFAARALPIGSGAVESPCKCLVAARATQAGMRGTEAGVQRIAGLRAPSGAGRAGGLLAEPAPAATRRRGSPPPSAGAHSGPDPVRPAVPPRTRLSAAPQTDRPAAPAPFAPLGVRDLCRGTPARINTEATVAIRTPR